MNINNSSLSSSGSDESDDIFADNVRVILLNSNSDKVLLINHEHTWDLPYFVYPNSLNFKTEKCCIDLQRRIGIKDNDNVQFTAIFELLGAFASTPQADPSEPAYCQLLLVESHLSTFELNQNLSTDCSWHDVKFLNGLLEKAPRGEDKFDCLKTVIGVLQSPEQFISSLREPRHKYGWHERASQWLCSVAEEDGASQLVQVTQHSMGPTSTILEAKYKNGSYFLKSPVFGTQEIEITEKVCKLFPGNTAVFLDKSYDLHSFVSRGFVHTRISEDDAPKIAMEMGSLQVSSIDYVADLESAGFRRRGPLELYEACEEWMSSPITERAFLGRIGELQEAIPKLKELCLKLEDYNIPLTLVHGDLVPHNATYKESDKEGYLIFDWEYAYIGHPFFEFHEMHQVMKPEDVKCYLSLWSKYRSEEELQDAFEIGRKLGWCVKMWLMLDCMEAGDAQRNSVLGEFAGDCLAFATRDLSDMCDQET